MKKIIIIFLPVIIVLGLLFVYIVQPKMNESKFNKLITEYNNLYPRVSRDSLMLNAYLSGFEYNGQVKKIAHEIAIRKFNYVLYFDSNREPGNYYFRMYLVDESLSGILIKKALLTLEKDMGTDSLASFIYNRAKYFYGCSGGLNEFGFADWNRKITIFEKASSPDVSKKLKSIVLKKLEDPLWLTRYLTMDKVLEVCLSKRVNGNVLGGFFILLEKRWQEYLIEIVDNIPDSWIINHRKCSPFFKSRVIKIAEHASFKKAYGYLTDVNAISERNLLVKNKRTKKE